ncbi:hypothetical protein LGMS210922A_08240 [Lactococcus garvieae]|nr:hypothetical protein LGMS210922A_08240 [Lactococcus garvieae]BDW51148.1 hypothetical protein LG21E68_08230 [Lactococcus garvieae]
MTKKPALYILKRKGFIEVNNMASTERVKQMKFETVYPLYLAKVEKKGRTKEELDEVLTWLTGYTNPSQLTGSLGQLIENQPFNDNAPLITGVICGVRVEEIEDNFMKKLRYMDKVVDELAKGKSVEKIKRSPL